MANNERSWNQFNSDFTIPESGDAARVALEARASLETWLQNSLDRLEADMQKRAQVHIDTFTRDVDETKKQVKEVRDQFNRWHDLIKNLSPNDPKLHETVAALKDQTDKTRTAMDAAVKEWEEKGKQAVSTAVSIAKTVATM